VVEIDEPPCIELKHNKMLLSVRPETTQENVEAIVDAWYRKQIKEAALPLIAKWEPILGTKVKKTLRATDEDQMGKL